MPSPRENIAKLPLPVHGGIDYAEIRRLGLSPQDMLDFSVSVNPFGPPPGIHSAISQAPVGCYPDSQSTQVREALGAKLTLSPDQIIVGSGSTELIRLIALAFFGRGDCVLIPQPTYGEYETACRIADAEVLKPWMASATGLKLDIPGLKTLIRERSPKGLFVCNPNNPTGEYLSKRALKSLVAGVREGVGVIDEAYIGFTESAWDSTELIETGGIIVVRSMTKDFALPGLRLGYAISSKEIISILNRVKPPWNVSSVAQAAAVFVLGQDAYLKTCARKLEQSKRLLIDGMRARGLEPLPSQANFVLVQVGDAARFRRALIAHGIVVRDCTSFGLPAYVRLAPRTKGECEKLLAALDDPEVRSCAS